METELYEVSEIGKGKLFIMPRPYHKNLDENLLFYKSKNVDKIISLLEYDEAEELGLSREKKECENVGIEFEQYPIKDGDIPQEKPFKEFVKNIYSEIIEGKNVSVHCWAGIGRSGVLTCSLLKLNGFDVDDAVALVSEKRAYPVPETNTQYDFLKEIAF
jgi:protein-tyrosine phosphatase